MDRSHTMPRLCFIMALILSLIGVALRSICMLISFDPDPGYFSEGILPTLSDALYFVVLVAVAVCAFLIPRGALSHTLRTPMRLPLAICLGSVLALFTVLSLIISFQNRRDNIMIAPSLLGLLASIYYFASANRKEQFPDWLSFLGYLPALWSIAAVGEIYFDHYTTMNSPVKISLQFACLGFMLIVLAELRFRVNRSTPRYSASLLAIGSYACLTGSLPLLLATGAGQLDNIRHLFYAVVLLVAGVYGLYLLFCCTCLPGTLSVQVPADVSPVSPEEITPNAE